MHPIRRPVLWTHRVHQRRARQLLSWLCAGAIASVIAACGGGGSGDTAAVSPSAGTSASTSATATALSLGPISGFGSIIVNGVRFDDTDCTVTDADGVVQTRDALRLGMIVQVDSGALGGATVGVARAIRYGNQVKGPVESVDAGSSTLVVLGQTIDVSADTVFDGITGGLAGVATGAQVEVYGLPDSATGHVLATRIEAETGLTAYKLRGTVAALDTTAKTFSINGALLSYAGIASVPTALANGVTVRTTLATAQSGGRWVVSSMRVEGTTVASYSEAHLRGTITAFTSTTQFSVSGIPVDASAAAFPDGTAGIVLGATVTVDGTTANGVLTATSVALNAYRGFGGRLRNELHGTIASIDTTAKTFTLNGVRGLRGLTISYAGSVSYVGGSEAALTVGTKVEVTGSLAAGGTIISATEIDFGG